MERDASLDDFLDAGDEPGPTDGEPADGRATTGADEPASPAAVEGADATYAWSPGDAACDACGADAERRWRDEAGLVCEGCKDW